LRKGRFGALTFAAVQTDAGARELDSDDSLLVPSVHVRTTSSRGAEEIKAEHHNHERPSCGLHLAPRTVRRRLPRGPPPRGHSPRHLPRTRCSCSPPPCPRIASSAARRGRRGGRGGGCSASRMASRRGRQGAEYGSAKSAGVAARPPVPPLTTLAAAAALD
jgi:hypothetical protein